MNSELENLRRESQTEWRRVENKPGRVGMDIANEEIARNGLYRVEDTRVLFERFTKTEIKILHYIIDGFTREEICYELGIEEVTYRWHMANMKKKTNG